MVVKPQALTYTSQSVDVQTFAGTTGKSRGGKTMKAYVFLYSTNPERVG